MQTRRLTKKQQRLVSDLHEICQRLKLDFYNITEYDPRSRTVMLELSRDRLIRSEVVASYTLVDEFLSCSICRYYFGNRRPFPKLWKTKKFQLFNYHVVEELSLLQKLRFVKSFAHMPRALAADIERLNSLRNGLVHAYFPQNLKKSQPVWKGKSIFGAQGLRQFRDDMSKVFDFFAETVRL